MATNTMKANLQAAKQSDRTTPRLLHWTPVLLALIAAALLLVSIQFPYWRMKLHAPQYPEGLEMRVFVNRLTGDEDPRLDEVVEIDGLNHYIGMRPLGEAAQVERAIAVPAVVLMSALLVIGIAIRRRWLWLLAIPALFFPFVFLADLGFWLYTFGHSLDPYAPLSSAIQSFTPTLLGEGIIGQFRTIAQIDTGWILAVTASLLLLVALALRWLEWRKGKPHA